MNIYWWHFLLIFFVSYLIGNINFAILITKCMKTDIRKMGSGNPGTINMVRNFGIKIGALTLILDCLKGFLPSLIGFLLAGTAGLYTAGLGVIIGHIYPAVYKFKGGKGISSTLGIFLFAQQVLTVVLFIIAFIYTLIYEYGSIGSLFCVSVLVMVEGFKCKTEPFALYISFLLFAIFILTWFAHRKNIYRLLMGVENKTNLRPAVMKLFKNKNKDKSEAKIKDNNLNNDNNKN